MIIIGYNEQTKGISSVGRYHKGLTKIENLVSVLPADLVHAFNKDSLWTRIFGCLSPNMSCYKTKLGYYIVDTELPLQCPQQSCLT
jgi:hypothetical protein